MSGLEVAGLALAILPVLASCIEQYNTCLGPFSRYRRFAKEARDYCREIEVQRTIFSNACRNLLEEVVDHDAASGMLNALDQQAWANGQLDERLAQLLGESLKACVTTISLIEERLQEISGESERLKCIVENEKKVLYPSVLLHHLLTMPSRQDNPQNDQRQSMETQCRRKAPSQLLEAETRRKHCETPFL